MSISANGHLNDEANGGEDSDLESDFATAAAESGEDYYQPISDGSDSDSEEPDSSYLQLNEANGNGVSSLDLNADDSESESEQEETEASVSTAIGEDERRRNLELTQERSERIREAMRGVEFRGAPPPWADRLPEEQWVDQLRRIRGETSLTLNPSSSSSN
ncbi:hypothetical protein LUZ60_003868 [Juncus effusus]|nr:hypothetical protein LUZ60_003868 [Juncus effusus]